MYNFSIKYLINFLYNNVNCVIEVIIWLITEGIIEGVERTVIEGAGGKMGKYTMTRTSNKMRTWNAPDWNSYEDMVRYSSVPIIGGIYRSRGEYLAYQENLRWWKDYSRNTGINLEDISYPIRAGLYNGYRSGFEPYISATESVISLYGGNSLRKWL